MFWRVQIYAAPLAGGARAVVLFNRHQHLDPNFPSQNITVWWGSIGLPANVTVSIQNFLHMYMLFERVSLSLEEGPEFFLSSLVYICTYYCIECPRLLKKVRCWR